VAAAATVLAAAWESSSFARPARRIRWILFAGMSIASAAPIATATVNSIAGADVGRGAA
jgi:hypothetical protein